VVYPTDEFLLICGESDSWDGEIGDNLVAGWVLKYDLINMRVVRQVSLNTINDVTMLTTVNYLTRFNAMSFNLWSTSFVVAGISNAGWPDLDAIYIEYDLDLEVIDGYYFWGARNPSDQDIVVDIAIDPRNDELHVLTAASATLDTDNHCGAHLMKWSADAERIL